MLVALGWPHGRGWRLIGVGLIALSVLFNFYGMIVVSGLVASIFWAGQQIKKERKNDSLKAFLSYIISLREKNAASSEPNKNELNQK